MKMHEGTVTERWRILCVTIPIVWVLSATTDWTMIVVVHIDLVTS